MNDFGFQMIAIFLLLIGVFQIGAQTPEQLAALMPIGYLNISRPFWTPPPPPQGNVTNFAVPASFDARTTWPGCPSIGKIHNQGMCTSSYAAATVSMISDRECIANSTKTDFLSIRDALECALNTNGCNGGFPEKVLEMYYYFGLATGDPTGSNIGCKPWDPFWQTGQRDCIQNCIAGYMGNSYWDDKRRFGTYQYFIQPTEDLIKAELVINGPIVAQMSIFSSYFSYKNGTYQKQDDDDQIFGGQFVKIIGYGTDAAGNNYWTVANSNGTAYGEQGFMKILRGANAFGIEDLIFASYPIDGRLNVILPSYYDSTVTYNDFVPAACNHVSIGYPQFLNSTI